MSVIGAIDSGDVALIILSAFWALLVGFLCVVLLNTYQVLASTKMIIDTMREETVPLMREAKTSIERTNVILESAGIVSQRVEKLSGLVEQAAGSPLIKVISFGAGLQKATQRFRGKGK